MRVILLGPPGAGKGTLANLLKDEWKIPHVSTGDILRDEMKKNTKLGSEIKKFVESGQLVPDEVITQIIEKKIAQDKTIQQGFMFDGFPRTTKQAQDLDKILSRKGLAIDHAIYLESTLPVIIQRLTGRRICRNCGALFHTRNKPPQKAGQCDLCGGEVYQRSDDNEETIRKRMDVYSSNTKPIIDYYKKKDRLLKLNGDQDSEELQTELVKLLHDDKKRKRNKDQVSGRN